jgi:caa(3)-type oxidase subunit IV
VLTVAAGVSPAGVFNCSRLPIFNLGPFDPIVALAVAICNAVLIALFFMHIKGSSRLLHLAALAGIIWFRLRAPA